jgi:hypothetical protein
MWELEPHLYFSPKILVVVDPKLFVESGTPGSDPELESNIAGKKHTLK